MRYQAVARIITVYIDKAGNKCAIDVCPEHAEVVAGDKVVWNVQNAPTGVKVTVGNFRRLDPPPDVFLRKHKAPLMREKTVRFVGLAFATRTADVGYYKYDILFDGHTVLDPDLEIKRPN
jgi:hypothetical protein